MRWMPWKWPTRPCFSYVVLLSLTSCLSLWSAPWQEYQDKQLDQWVETYKTLHRSPELSKREKNTAAFLTERLKKLGFEVTTDLGGHGLVGRLTRGKGQKILVRTDMDALPVTEQTGLKYHSRVTDTYQGKETGVMHACGHDMHMAVWLGVAETLAKHATWNGTLLMLAQPAEELGLGAKAMLKDGLLEKFGKPDQALALHVNAEMPTGVVGYRAGYALANADTVKVVVRGRGGHGAFPHQARDPVTLAAKIVLAVQTFISREIDPTDPAVISVGKIEGGTKANVIPAEVTLQMTVRTFSDKTRQFVIEGIRRHAEGLAAASNFPKSLYPKVEVREGFTPSTYNTPDLANRAGQLWRGMGMKAVETKPVMGAEDFSRYGRAGMDAFIFWLGTVDPKRWKQQATDPLPSLHSPEFAPVPRITLATGTRAMTALVLDLFQRPATAE